MAAFCKILQKLLSVRIKQLSVEDLETAETDAPLRQQGTNEEGSAREESSADSEESEPEVRDLFEQVDYLSNKYVTIERMQQVGLEFQIEISVQQKYHLLFLSFVEDALLKTPIHQIEKLSDCFMRQDDNGQWVVDIAGSNIQMVLNLADHLFKKEQLQSNSIWDIFYQYGVEAARQAIVEQASHVFSVYSIEVDERHLALIADYMTQLGEIRACSRNGIHAQPHPLAKASFERASWFVAQAAIFSESDHVVQPSSSITFGQMSKQGTGCFNLKQQIEQDQVE